VSNADQTWRKILRTAWVAIRFVLFGIGGFLVMLNAGLVLFDGSPFTGHRLLARLLAVLLVAIGALSMMFGTGSWHRRAYAFVFLSFAFAPILFWLFPRIDKGGGVLIMTVPAIVTYLIVRGYYRWRDARQKSASTFDAFKPEDMTHP